MNQIFLSILIVSSMGLIFGLGLSYVSKKFEVDADPKIAEVREELPGANCGACGQKSCDTYAMAVVAGKVKTNLCTVGGPAVAVKVSEIMGVVPDHTDKMVARVICSGTYSQAKTKFDYAGIRDCAAASILSSGPKSCTYGCVGMGSCMNVCEYDAIYMNDGVAVIDEEMCVACKRCIEMCPKKVIKLTQADKKVTVRCNSFDKGAVVGKNCKVGCIGCQKCFKICRFGAIRMDGTLAIIDGELCTSCGECIDVCPTNTITTGLVRNKTEKRKLAAQA